MATKLFIVYTNPKTDEDEAAYNDWYTNVHLPDITAIPGFIAATRYQIAPESAGNTRHRYMAIYEIADAVAVQEAMANLAAARDSLRMADVLQRSGEGAAVTSYWQQISERVTGAPRQPAQA
jgi:hypothetical protein